MSANLNARDDNLGEPSSEETIFGKYAGFITRAVAIVIDLGLFAVVMFMISMAAGLINAYFIHGSNAQNLVLWGVVALGLLLPNVYWVVMWTLTGQTIGKGIMGVRVVRTDGSRVTLGPAIRRVIGYYVSAILTLGYLWVLVDAQRQGWHDHMAGTYVVYTRPKEETSRVSAATERPGLRHLRAQAAAQKQKSASSYQ